MATIDKDLLLEKIDRLLKLHSYAREDWFANVIHNTVWDAPEIEGGGDTIYRADAIETVRNVSRDLIQDKCMPLGCATDFTDALSALPSADAVEVIHDTEWVALRRNEYEDLLASADAVQGWIPCSERLPKVNQRVLLATNDGRVFVGYREKPDLVWQVTEKDGRKHWVYDPENYTDDIEILPKSEDCGFSKDDVYSDGFLSVASVNYDDRFVGVTAWMPLPKPYKGGDE